MLHAEKAALEKGVDFLNAPGIDLGGQDSRYEYKHWTPVVIPFIQASSGIWDPGAGVVASDAALPGILAGLMGTGALPTVQAIAIGRSFDFQILTPKDHPFLLIDVKVAAAPQGASRFQNVFSLANQPYLAWKYPFPNNENVITTLTAVSPGGRPVWGGLQNVTGLLNSVATVGPEPHMERIPLSNTQCNRSGRGSLQHHLLFPEEGIIKVTVENQRAANTIDVNGACFGYVLMK